MRRLDELIDFYKSKRTPDLLDAVVIPQSVLENTIFELQDKRHVDSWLRATSSHSKFCWKRCKHVFSECSDCIHCLTPEDFAANE